MPEKQQRHGSRKQAQEKPRNWVLFVHNLFVILNFKELGKKEPKIRRKKKKKVMFFKSPLQQQWQLLSEGQTRWPGQGNCLSYPILHMLTQARAQTKQTELLGLIL